MNDEPRAFVGVDWAVNDHQACVIDAGGNELGNAKFAHSGAGLTAMADWILELSGAEPQHVAVGIETPHGPVVESLQGRGFRVHSISPRQLDRFRDRFFPSGAKDDSRDAQRSVDPARFLPDPADKDPEALVLAGVPRGVAPQEVVEA